MTEYSQRVEIEYDQEVVWMEWTPANTIAGGKFTPVKLARCPDRVWTLYGELDKDRTPALPIIPVHRHGAFSEDPIHDWDWRGYPFAQTLHYYTRVMDRSCWILLEYERG